MVSPRLGRRGEGLKRVSSCSLYRDFQTRLSPILLPHLQRYLVPLIVEHFKVP